jgi:hypothetical protein
MGSICRGTAAPAPAVTPAEAVTTAAEVARAVGDVEDDALWAVVLLADRANRREKRVYIVACYARPGGRR